MRFYDHMLASLAKHSLIDLRVKAVGDVDVDAHHTVEDVAIVLGDALREALGDKRGISRFGDATVPLDEALVQAVVDVAGRPYVVHEGEPEGQVYAVIGGTYTGSLTRHVLESFAYHAGIALHVRVLAGRDPHHLVEAQFKAVARALRAAVARDPRVVGHPEREGQPVAAVTVPWRAARHGRGMLVTRGRADAVAAWAARGLVPVHVVPFGDWTVVQPAGPSLGHAPYDDALQVLAARPVPWRLRSTIGLFAVGGNAVVTMHPHGWRAVQRWVVWVPRRGVVSPDRLAAGRPGDLARTAGAGPRGDALGRRRPARSLR